MSRTCIGCGQNPCINPSFCSACDREAKQHPRRRTPREQRTWKLLGDLSMEMMYAAYLRDRPTPRTVIDAVVYCVLERGLAALKEPENVERLSRCDAAAKAEIDRQIEKISR
jgi:hypothetical protein